jgi:hypothetical protein
MTESDRPTVWVDGQVFENQWKISSTPKPCYENGSASSGRELD